MRRAALLIVAVLAIATPRMSAALSGASWPGSAAPSPEAEPAAVAPSAEASAPTSDEEAVRLHVQDRLVRDLNALALLRPSYPFWAHVFAIPDGSVAFGDAGDGRLLAVFPTGGDWARSGRWEDPSLAPLLEGEDLPRGLGERRDRVAGLLEQASGTAIHNPTRGSFLQPNARRYGGFVGEWSAIYERFGVPADLGLAQAAVESGLAGTIKSEAGAIGFCQWMPGNWKRLNRLAPDVIEAENQTTQAGYCAAYLAVLATKYGSFIPALSEHHAGGANVGRTIINGGRLGASDVRERYLRGGALALDLRSRSPRTFSDVTGTYGPRSFRYAEMVFGNAPTVAAIREGTPQERIFAMRTSRAVPIREVTRLSGLTAEEVRRYNPALVRQVPRGATIYLPQHVEALGPDVSFWHRPAPPAFAAVLSDFVRLDAPLERWEEVEFEAVLDDFRQRFRATGSEEGKVMDTVLGYVMQQLPLNRQVLSRYRNDPHIHRLFDEALRVTSQDAPFHP